MIAPITATMPKSERAVAAKLPTTSCQRGIGLPSSTSIVPRSSEPAIAPAQATIGKKERATGARLKTWPARKPSGVLMEVIPKASIMPFG
ncbi:MAG: hypothetical protein M3151_12370 [Actinomycetota bacterium]|nr:hypothetical protein [Actinomycetota bacterium]